MEIKIKEKINFLRKLADWSEKNAEELSVQENLLSTNREVSQLPLEPGISIGSTALSDVTKIGGALTPLTF